MLSVCLEIQFPELLCPLAAAMHSTCRVSGDGKVLNKRGHVLGLLHSNNNSNSCNLDIYFQPAKITLNCASTIQYTDGANKCL